MTHLEFCHWVTGYSELASKVHFDRRKAEVIANHLALAETVSGNVSGELLGVKKMLLHYLQGGESVDWLSCFEVIRKGVRNILVDHSSEKFLK